MDFHTALDILQDPEAGPFSRAVAAKVVKRHTAHPTLHSVGQAFAETADIDCGMDFDTWLEVYGGFEDQPGYAERRGE